MKASIPVRPNPEKEVAGGGDLDFPKLDRPGIFQNLDRDQILKMG